MRRPRRRSELFAAGVFVAAVAVLVAQLLTEPSTVVAAGAERSRTVALGRQFDRRTVALVAVAACAAGVSGTVLLVSGSEPADGPSTDQSTSPDSSDELLDARREEWDTVAERLDSNEQVVYRTLLDADGVLPQSDIVDRTELSKATVSRTLDSLEARDLVERKRRGMGNTVLLT